MNSISSTSTHIALLTVSTVEVEHTNKCTAKQWNKLKKNQDEKHRKGKQTKRRRQARKEHPQENIDTQS